MCLTLPETLISVVGIEKVLPTLGRPRGLPAAAAAVLDRRADEPLHLDVDRRHPRRRPAGGPRRAARQRPHPGAGRPGRTPGAALHPVLGLPQRLPGLRAGRRPRLRLGLPRPDRRDPQPAAARASSPTIDKSLPFASTLCGACFDVCPVRIDDPGHARAPATQGRRQEAAGASPGTDDHDRCPVGLRRSQALRVHGEHGRGGRQGHEEGLPRPDAMARLPVDASPRPTHATDGVFRSWWKRTRGEGK